MRKQTGKIEKRRGQPKCTVKEILVLDPSPKFAIEDGKGMDRMILWITKVGLAVEKNGLPIWEGDSPEVGHLIAFLIAKMDEGARTNQVHAAPRAIPANRGSHCSVWFGNHPRR